MERLTLFLSGCDFTVFLPLRTYATLAYADEAGALFCDFRFRRDRAFPRFGAGKGWRCVPPPAGLFTNAFATREANLTILEQGEAWNYRQY